MDENKPTGNLSHGLVPQPGEAIIDYRTRIAAHRAEAAERRHLELLEQRSPKNAPAVRIRIWERVHQINLPRSLSHRLVELIAAQTGLTTEEVRDEQRLRAMPSAPVVS